MLWFIQESKERVAIIQKYKGIVKVISFFNEICVFCSNASFGFQAFLDRLLQLASVDQARDRLWLSLLSHSASPSLLQTQRLRVQVPVLPSLSLPPWTALEDGLVANVPVFTRQRFRLWKQLTHLYCIDS